MLAVKAAYKCEYHDHRWFIETMDGRLAFFAAGKIGKIQEKDLHYCHENFKLRGESAKKVRKNDKFNIFVLRQYGIVIDGYK